MLKFSFYYIVVCFFPNTDGFKKNTLPLAHYCSFQVKVAWTSSAFGWKKIMSRAESERMYLPNL